MKNLTPEKVSQSSRSTLTNKTVSMFVVSALSAALVFSNASFAFEHNNNSNNDNSSSTMKAKSSYQGKHQGKHHFKKMVKFLQLNETQKAEIKAIKEAAREQNKSLHESLKLFRQEIKALSQAHIFDDHAFVTLHNSYQPSLAQAALAKAKTMNAILQVLNEEQKAKWLSFMEKRQKKRAMKRS